MYNVANSFHIATEVLFCSCFLVLSKAKVRTSFYTSVFYTNSSKSQNGIFDGSKGKGNFLKLFDIRLASDWIIWGVFKKLSLYQLFSDHY